MVNPSLRVQQVQLPDHFNDVNFMKIPRVDRCTTCHMAADRKGFEDPKIKTVFRTHPSFHRMVGSESLHPATTFGCTPCHGGRDRATSFWSAGHSPETEAQERRVDEEVRLGVRQVQRDARSCPLKYAEAGCYRCHADEANFPEAPTLDAGMRIVESLGCWGCHRIEGLEKQHLPKVGPVAREGRVQGLEGLDDALGDEPAVVPRRTRRCRRSSTSRTSSNVSGPKPPTAAQEKMNEDGRIENDTMVNAIVAYLFDKSQPGRRARRSRARATPRAAQKLLAERGCFGCHVADPERAARPRRDLPPVRPEPRRRRVQGLAGLDLPLDPEPEGVEPRHEDAEPAPDRRRTRSTSPSTSRR